MSQDIDQIMAQAMQLHQAGRLVEAEKLYRQVLAREANHSDALHLLGMLAHQSGHSAAGMQLVQRAIALRPEVGYYYNTLGSILQDTVGMAAAIDAYQRAVQLIPEDVVALTNLSDALREVGRLEEAMQACRTAIAIRPEHAPAYLNLGNALLAARRNVEALEAYQQATKLQPDSAETLSNYAHALTELGRCDDAIDACRRAIAINPRCDEAHVNLGYALQHSGHVREALEEFRFVAANGTKLKSIAASNLLYALHFDPASDAQAVFAEHQAWAHRFAEPLRASWRPHENDRSPQRRLRIGYVSPDFYDQAESFFTVPLLEAHDHHRFEIHCYASVRQSDAITQRLRRAADVWHDVLALSDEALAAQIRSDGIDILVDLTMHMRDHRLMAFARKPAPLQVCWLAYPGRTGLPTMDYRLTDRYLDPRGDELCDYERTLYLDHWVCYDPLAAEPAVNELPASRNGFITFGCLNNPCKINEAVLRLWGRVLNAVPQSRLIVLAEPGNFRTDLLRSLSEQQIAPDRIGFVPRRPRRQYLETYHLFDIALDTFPYNGITTTCDALWMGVPVVTFAGEPPASRAGLSLLAAAQFPQLVASSQDDLVGLAAEWAHDVMRLSALRGGLRQRVRSSRLMDPRAFARNLEAAFREIWTRWCARV